MFKASSALKLWLLKPLLRSSDSVSTQQVRSNSGFRLMTQTSVWKLWKWKIPQGDASACWQLPQNIPGLLPVSGWAGLHRPNMLRPKHRSHGWPKDWPEIQLGHQCHQINQLPPGKGPSPKTEWTKEQWQRDQEKDLPVNADHNIKTWVV